MATERCTDRAGATRKELRQALVAYWREADANQMLGDATYTRACKRVAFKPGTDNQPSNVRLDGPLKQTDLATIAKASFWSVD